MFNFNLNWDAIADFNTNFDSKAFEKELAAIVNVATVAAVNSPAVVEAPKNTAPAKAEVQQVVAQVVQAVAPVVAPTVPAKVISKLEQIIPEQVVSNPQVKASGAGTTVAPVVVDKITTSVSTAFNKDAQKDLELKKAINTVATTPVTSKPEIVTLPGTTTTTTTAKLDSVNLPFDTTKPATSQTMPFDTTKPATTVNLTTTTATATSAANVQTPQNFSGDGTKTRPLLLNGNKFTGERNGIKYENGLPVNATREDILQADREARMKAEAEVRAKSNPLYNFANRPAAPAPDDDYIYYYSWIGGVTSGEWKLYRATNTPDNAAKYLGRSIGGETQATGGSAVGANALKNQPKVSPSGTIVSIGAGNTTATTTPSTTTPSTTTPSTTTPSTTTVAKPVGTPPAFVYDSVSNTWVRPPYPTDGIQYTWDDSAGWVNVNVKPGPTGTSLTDTSRNLAVNTFKNTLALLFGPLEANQPWMDELYSLVSSYYKTGSTIEEATNLSLRDARNNPKLTKFTNRFKAIFALEDMVRAGRPVYVPTIAEYVGTEEKLGDVFSRAGLGDLANQEILSQVIGTGKSVTETTAIITDAFALVDNAPDAWKAAINKQFPYATRNQLAKALLLGEKGAQALEKEFQTIGVQAAAEQQGLTINQARAQDIFSQGYGYTQALGKFGEVARILPRAQQLSAFSKEEPLTQLDVEQARIEKLASKQRKLEELEQKELARFSGQSGVGKTSLTQQRYI